jgi:hypothetical protein
LPIPRIAEPEEITRMVLFVADRIGVHRRRRPFARSGTGLQPATVTLADAFRLVA